MINCPRLGGGCLCSYDFWEALAPLQWTLDPVGTSENISMEGGGARTLTPLTGRGGPREEEKYDPKYMTSHDIPLVKGLMWPCHFFFFFFFSS